MREITQHKINPVNARIGLAATKEVGPGGAAQMYRVTTGDEEGHTIECLELYFPSADGKNTHNVTHEVMLAILIDRLIGFQNGPFACEDNAVALSLLMSAKARLDRRSIERQSRGVEGKLEK
jgi:hypothetical protein